MSYFLTILSTIDLLLEKFPVNFVQAESTFFFFFFPFTGGVGMQTLDNQILYQENLKNIAISFLRLRLLKIIEVQPWLKTKLWNQVTAEL